MFYFNFNFHFTIFTYFAKIRGGGGSAMFAVEVL